MKEKERRMRKNRVEERERGPRKNRVEEREREGQERIG